MGLNVRGKERERERFALMSAEKKDERNRKNERDDWSINSGGGLCSGASKVPVVGINSSYAHILFTNIDSSSLA
jgi:hypothetical protein